MNEQKSENNPKFKIQNLKLNDELSRPSFAGCPNNQLNNESRIYLTYVYHTEKNLAQRITAILKEKNLKPLLVDTYGPILKDEHKKIYDNFICEVAFWRINFSKAVCPSRIFQNSRHIYWTQPADVEIAAVYPRKSSPQ